ncbi:MAG: hypothetical protein ACP5OA_02335 [Candidatus Woesearchaeota archaeon]
MIDISSLEQYFPKINTPLTFDKYTFTISFKQDKEIFLINLQIKQQDTKEEHLIKFRFGIGKDKPKEKAVHETDKPHFEIEVYKREETASSITVYFTFRNSDDNLLDYAKGTIVLIDKIIKQFIEHHNLDENIINKLVYDEAVLEELSEFEPILIDALYECYKHSDLIVREGDKPVIIKTTHNFKKYLGIKDLDPLFLPLLDKIEER